MSLLSLWDAAPGRQLVTCLTPGPQGPCPSGHGFALKRKLLQSTLGAALALGTRYVSSCLAVLHPGDGAKAGSVPSPHPTKDRSPQFRSIPERSPYPRPFR